MSKFTRKKTLTLPILSMSHEEVAYVKITSAMYKSHDASEEEGDKKPMVLVQVINLESGEEMLLICHSLIEAVLNRDADAYVGKCYEIANAPKVKGKKYRNIDMYEIECGD